MKYDFICPKCNETIVIECRMSDYDNVAPYLQCEKCKEPLKRLLSPPSFLGTTGGYDSVAGKASWQN